MLDMTNIIQFFKWGIIMNLTNSQEEYLKTIYILKNTINEIRVTDIAEKLNKSKASVNNAINNLKQAGFINYEPYGKIDAGNQVGRQRGTDGNRGHAE